MRWYTFFFLFLVELCTYLALSVIAKSFQASGRLGIDADSGSSAFGASESKDPSNGARQSLNNHESATINNANEERGAMLAMLKELFSFEHKYQQVERVEYDFDEQLSRLLKVLSPKTTQPNHEGQLSSLPQPGDLFDELHFTKVDLERNRIILWLKYFDIHGQKNNPRDHYEAFDLLMSIDGVDKKDVARFLEKAEKDSDLKAFSNSMKDVVEQESRLLTLLKNDKNTPEAVFSKLQVKVSQDDMNFLQWLRYCQHYKTKYSKKGKDFDSRIVDVLEKEKPLDELMQLFTSIRDTMGLTTSVNQLLAATRRQKWLEEKKVPKDLYADLIKAEIPVHEQLPNFVQWLKFVSLYDKTQGKRSVKDVVKLLAPQSGATDLFAGAALLDELKNVKSVEGIVEVASQEFLDVLKRESVSPDELKELANVFRWKHPNDPRQTFYDNVI